MTYQMDRTYWRASSTRSLIENALNSGDELTIALGERLQEYDDQEYIIDDLQKENAELERRVESWQEEVLSLRNQLGLD